MLLINDETVKWQAAFEQMEQTREAAKDFFNNISRHLIDEAPRRSQELCVKRMVRNKQIRAAISRHIYVDSPKDP